MTHGVTLLRDFAATQHVKRAANCPIKRGLGLRRHRPVSLTSVPTSSAQLDREFDKVHMNALYGYGHQQAKKQSRLAKDTAGSRIGVVTATR